MKADSLSRRLAGLEEQQATPPKVRFLWYDEARKPPKPNETRIKLRWLDECRGGLE